MCTCVRACMCVCVSGVSSHVAEGVQCLSTNEQATPLFGSAISVSCDPGCRVGPHILTE